MVNGNFGNPYYNQTGNGQSYQQNFGNQQNNGYYQQNTQQQNTPYVPPILVDYVQGELAASIYPVAYNQKVILLDMDDPDRVYRKSRDASGKVTPLEKCRMVPEENKQLFDVDLKDYVKEDDILELIADAVQAEVDKRLSEISFKSTTSENKFMKKGDRQ
jgi:hypothetical protein